VPPQLDTSDAYSARVWNYLLGGKDNFAADRAACHRGDEVLSGLRPPGAPAQLAGEP
jgi:hypothetical protein